jgi:chitin disaccharide deacetylase
VEDAVHDRRIAVCIDDFGLHPGVNDAALTLARMGRVTAISCMVGAPLWRSGAPALAALDPDEMDVGLHLDLTAHPLAPAPGWPLPMLLALSGARLIDRPALRAQINAQLEAFELGVGRPPAHIDGHQHIHQFPVIREVLIDALLERYPRRRPWLRRMKRPPKPASDGFKPWLIERLGGHHFTRLAREKGFGLNTHLLGVYDFQGGADRYLALLARWIGAARHGDLLICHAALDTPAQDPIREARGNEYRVLSGGAFADLLAQADVRLAPLSRMPPVG